MYRSNRCIEEGPTMTATFPKEVCEPIYECPCERVCHREICHEVKHVKPVHTRIINHHIYHHTCTPCFTWARAIMRSSCLTGNGLLEAVCP